MKALMCTENKRLICLIPITAIDYVRENPEGNADVVTRNGHHNVFMGTTVDEIWRLLNELDPEPHA